MVTLIHSVLCPGMSAVFLYMKQSICIYLWNNCNARLRTRVLLQTNKIWQLRRQISKEISRCYWCRSSPGGRNIPRAVIGYSAVERNSMRK